MSIAISGKQSTNPIGTILPFAGIVAPEGHLFCDGSSQLRTTYPKLFAVIGTAYGSADGTHFNLPDLRGKFLRGVAHGQASDPDRASRTASATGGNTGDNVGSVQTDAMQGHAHSASIRRSSNNEGSGSANGAIIDSDGGFVTNPKDDGTNGTPRTTSETRPTNVNVEYIIKYDHVVNNYAVSTNASISDTTNKRYVTDAQRDKGFCKAWVNFDGTTSNPCTIRASYNVSSITKNGTGDYTVNFTTPMTDANYAPSISIGLDQTGSTGEYGCSINTDVTPTVNSIRVQTVDYNPSGTTTLSDRAYVFVQIFGN